MYNHIKILAINRSSKRAEIAPIKKETVQTLGFTSFPRSFHAAPHGLPRYTVAYQGTLWLTKEHCGSPRNTVAHQGTLWLTKVHCGSPRYTGAYHGTLWLTKIHRGSPRYIGKPHSKPGQTRPHTRVAPTVTQRRSQAHPRTGRLSSREGNP